MTLQEFAKKYDKSTRTVQRWVKLFDSDHSTMPTLIVSDNEPLFLFLLEKAGVQALSEDETTKQYGSLVNERIRDMRRMVPERLIPKPKPEIADFPIGGIISPKKTSKFFNEDGTPKGRKKAKKKPVILESKEEQKIDLSELAEFFSNNIFVGMVYCAVAMEFSFAMHTLSSSVFDSQLKVIFATVLGALLGLGMVTASMLTKSSEKRRIKDVSFAVIHFVMVLCMFPQLAWQSFAIAMTSVTIAYMLRVAIGDKIYKD